MSDIVIGETGTFDGTTRGISSNGVKKGQFRSEYFDRYPDHDLTPGSRMSDFLLSQILLRSTESERFMAPKHETWHDIDKSLNVFIDKDKEEADIERNDNRVPTSIVIPESYAIRETILTYLLTAFGTDPMWKMGGVGPEDTYGAIMLEHVQQNQVARSGVSTVDIGA